MAFLENVAALLTTNPQSPAWVDRVKARPGHRFRPFLPVWCSRNVELDDNHRLIGERLWALLPGIRNRLREGFAATGRERAIYQSAAILAIYGAFARQLGAIVAENGVKVPFWGQLEKLYTELLAINGLDASPAEDLLGLFYQAYRCWYFPFTLIPGAAPMTTRARGGRAPGAGRVRRLPAPRHPRDPVEGGRAPGVAWRRPMMVQAKRQVLDVLLVEGLVQAYGVIVGGRAWARLVERPEENGPALERGTR